MECRLYEGQKVVCVETWTPSNGNGDKGPVKDQIYTIRHIKYDEFWKQISIALVEIKNTPRPYPGDPARKYGLTEQYFKHTRFRPLTDISIFEKMLDTTNIDVKEFEEA